MRVLLLALCLLTACGDYVRYEKGSMPGGSNVGTLDEATRMRLAGVDHLDHLGLEAVLAAHVVPGADGYVYFDYPGLAADAEALSILDQYLAALDVVRAEQLKDGAERLAYWINGYNAHVIRAVLDAWGGDRAYSVEQGGFIVFDLERHCFGGQALSLNQVEHGVVRGDETHTAFTRADAERQALLRALHSSLWSGAPVDARVHVALNCASLSCPNLLGATPHVFRAATLEAQLAQASQAFAENPAKGAGPDGISQIFNWYARDFEAVYGNAAGFIRQHRAEGLQGVNLDLYLRYDWALNIAP